MPEISTTHVSPRFTVLLVDDHSMVREVLVEIFNKNNLFQIVGEASSGLEAIDKAKALQPHLILMDINMPDVNGIEATRILRKQLPQTHIIGLSVDDDESLGFILKKVGALGLIDKTKDPQEIIEDILKYMEIQGHEKSIES